MAVVRSNQEPLWKQVAEPAFEAQELAALRSKLGQYSEVADLLENFLYARTMQLQRLARNELHPERRLAYLEQARAHSDVLAILYKPELNHDGVSSHIGV